MWRNYLNIAIRNLLRHKVYSLINILGLAIGMACCVLILLFIQHQWSYNRYHEKSDRIYKVMRQKQRPNGDTYYTTTTLGPVGPALETDFPEVERATRYINRVMWVQYEDGGFDAQTVIADPGFLDIFTYPLIKGDLKTGLQTPYSAFITQRLARKLFGNTDPIGKVATVRYKWVNADFTITGILKDIPRTSSWELQFDFLSTTMPPSQFKSTLWETWRPNSDYHPLFTYILLKEGAAASSLELKDFALRHLGDEAGRRNSYALQPLPRLHLYTGQDYGISNQAFADAAQSYGDIRKSYTFGLIGLFILVIACINFMNLTTARSASRAREVGMRKVVGAFRTQLIRQFLGESVVVTVVAMGLAVGLAFWTLPYVNAFLEIHLDLEANTFWALLGLTLIVGLLAGSYPAFFLSAFKPVAVLKGGTVQKSGAWVRKVLVVIQFAISIVLIVGTLVAFRQTEYMLQKDLGFDRNQLVVIPVMQKHRPFRPRYETIKQRFLQHHSTLKATTFLHPPGNENDTDKLQVLAEGMDAPIDVHHFATDHDFLDVFDVSLLAGRNFTIDDRTRFQPDRPPRIRVLLNETAAKHLGGIEPGNYIQFWNLDIEVIGIFKDFHNRSLHHAIRPLMLRYNTNLNHVAVKIDTQNLPETMAFLEGAWKEFLPSRPFEYKFMNAYLDAFYRSELKLRRLYAGCAGLAIFVACLGLMGLIAYTAEARTKEIGIRKVLGASETGIVTLLIREFLLLIGIASVLAWPVAWSVMSGWLQNFIYRIDLNVWFFILSTICALLIALLTIGYQAVKAARANPVEALRYE